MENDNRTELSRWVEERIAAVAPPAEWEPDVDLARARFESRRSAFGDAHRGALGARRRAIRRYWLAGAAAAAMACAVLVWYPGARVRAQELWRRLTVGRIEVVRVDFDSLPDEAKSLRAQPIHRPGPAEVAADAAEAAQRAGFVPRLPSPGVLPGTPKLSVLGPMSFGTVIQAADLELALRKAGISDEAVPRQWDGAQLTVEIGSTVNAAWDQVGIMQGLPPVLSTPMGFDVGAFATAVLRAAGMNRDAAQRFGRRLVSQPALLLGIATQDAVSVREVNLRTGPATLIEDLGDNGQVERVAILWSVPDRVYLLSGTLRADLAMAVANAIE